MDPVTGIMYPRISLQNQLPQYTLGVQVSDGLHTDTAQININVRAINQNQPTFIEPSSRNATVYVKEVLFTSTSNF